MENEKLEIEEKYQTESFNLSNLEKSIDLAVNYSLELLYLWAFGDIEAKKSVQQMVFPEGILYDFKNDCYRTKRVNNIFSVIECKEIEFLELKNFNRVYEFQRRIKKLTVYTDLHKKYSVASANKKQDLIKSIPNEKIVIDPKQTYMKKVFPT